MGMTTESVTERMQSSSALSPAVVEVEDISGGCGASFDILVVSSAFQGVRALERHRMVHEALGKDMESIHAVKLRCYTPEQYAAKQKAAETAAKED